MSNASDRYFQSGARKLVPEGIVGRVDVSAVARTVAQHLGGFGRDQAERIVPLDFLTHQGNDGRQLVLRRFLSLKGLIHFFLEAAVRLDLPDDRRIEDLLVHVVPGRAVVLIQRRETEAAYDDGHGRTVLAGAIQSRLTVQGPEVHRRVFLDIQRVAREEIAELSTALARLLDGVGRFAPGDCLELEPAGQLEGIDTFVDRDVPLEIEIAYVAEPRRAPVELDFDDRADLDVRGGERHLVVVVVLPGPEDVAAGQFRGNHFPVLEIVGHDGDVGQGLQVVRIPGHVEFEIATVFLLFFQDLDPLPMENVHQGDAFAHFEIDLERMVLEQDQRGGGRIQRVRRQGAFRFGDPAGPGIDGDCLRVHHSGKEEEEGEEFQMLHSFLCNYG